MLYAGHSQRVFFSRTNPAASREDDPTSRTAKLDNGDVSTEHDTSGPSRNSSIAANSASAGNSFQVGQSKRFGRDGRGRSNWNQRNGYRKPSSQSSAAHTPLTSAALPTSDAVGKTQQNSDADSAPSSSEIPGSSTAQHDQPLPQRNHQRRSYAKDQPPPSAVNSTQTVESADT